MEKLLVFVCVLFVLSCTNTKNSKEYVLWIEDFDNDFRHKRESESHNFDLLYTPADYWKAKGTSTTSGSLQTFILRVQEKKSDSSSFQIDKDYYSYALERDVKVLCDDSIYYCVMSHYENPYQIKPQHTVLLGFDIPTLNEKPFKVELIPKHLTTDTLVFDFPKLRLPILKTEN